MMWEYSNGIDNSEVNYKEEKPKGIGNSVTLPENITNIKKLDKVIDDLKNKYGYNSVTRAGKMNIGNILKLKD